MAESIVSVPRTLACAASGERGSDTGRINVLVDVDEVKSASGDLTGGGHLAGLSGGRVNFAVGTRLAKVSRAQIHSLGTSTRQGFWGWGSHTTSANLGLGKFPGGGDLTLERRNGRSDRGLGRERTEGLTNCRAS